MGKGFEGKPCEELLRALGLEKRKIKERPHSIYSRVQKVPFLERERGGADSDLFSVLTSNRT